VRTRRQQAAQNRDGTPLAGCCQGAGAHRTPGRADLRWLGLSAHDRLPGAACRRRRSRSPPLGRRPGSRLSANEIDKFVFPGFQGTPDFGSGRTVNHALEQVGILANKKLIPNDRRSAHETSGLRIGTNHLAFMDIGEHERWANSPGASPNW